MSQPAQFVPSAKQAEKWIKEANDTASTARRAVFLWTLAATTLFLLRVANMPVFISSLETYRFNNASLSSLRELDKEMGLVETDGKWGEALSKAFDAELATRQADRTREFAERNQSQTAAHGIEPEAPRSKKTKETLSPAERAAKESEEWRGLARACEIAPSRDLKKKSESREQNTPDTPCQLLNTALTKVRNKAIQERIQQLSNDPVKLPGSIEFKIGVYLLPVLICVCLIGLLHYAHSRRRRCFRLAALALRVAKQQPPAECAVLLDGLQPFPSWMAPVPASGSSGITREEFASLTRLPYSSLHSLLPFAPVALIVLLSAYAAARSTFLVEFTADIILATVWSDVPVREFLAFFLRSVPLHCISQLALIVWLWHDSSRSVPDSAPRTGEPFFPIDRRAWFLVSVSLAAMPVFLSLSNLFIGKRTPRFRTRKPQPKNAFSKRPGPDSRQAHTLEMRIQAELAGKTPPAEVFHKYLDVVIQQLQRENTAYLRVLDRLAVLTIEHDLSKERDEMIQAVERLAVYALSPIKTQPSGGAPKDAPVPAIAETKRPPDKKKRLVARAKQSALSRLVAGTIPTSGTDRIPRGRCRLIVDKQCRKSWKRVKAKEPAQTGTNPLTQLLRNRVKAWKDSTSKWHTRRKEREVWRTPTPARRGSTERKC